MHKTLERHFVLTKTFFASVLAIALPIAVQNAISFGVQVMDSIMLGRLGDVAISAANLGGQPFTIMMSFGFGLSSGGMVLIAQYWGKKDVAHIETVMRMTMQFVTAAAILITALSLLFPRQIVMLFTKEEPVIEAAVSYLRIAALCYIPYAIGNSYIMCLRAIEKVNISVLVYGVSFFVNIFFNYVFIFGKLGFPELGVRGAALGTVLARVSEFIMVMIYMYTKEHTIGFRLHHCLQWNGELLNNYVRHSVPVVGNELVWGIGFAFTSVIMGRIGSVFVAANSVAGVLNQLAFVSLVGIANAAAILTGKTIGAGDNERAKKVANTLLLVSFCMGLFNCVLILLLRKPFLSFYNISQETYAAAYSILGIMAFMQITMSVELTSIVGILRGGGDTRAAFRYDCGCLWFVGIPLGILTGWVLKLPVAAVYFFMKLDSPCKAFLSLRRLFSGAWVQNVTLEEPQKTL